MKLFFFISLYLPGIHFINLIYYIIFFIVFEVTVFWGFFFFLSFFGICAIQKNTTIMAMSICFI